MEDLRFLEQIARVKYDEMQREGEAGRLVALAKRAASTKVRLSLSIKHILMVIGLKA